MSGEVWMEPAHWRILVYPIPATEKRHKQRGCNLIVLVAAVHAIVNTYGVTNWS